MSQSQAIAPGRGRALQANASAQEAARTRVQFNRLLAIANEVDREVAAVDTSNVDLLEDTGAPANASGGAIAKKLREDGTFVQLTNYPEHHILDMWHDIEGFALMGRRRGPMPSIVLLDSFIIYLMWVKLSLDFEPLAAMLGLKATTCRDAVARVRPFIYQGLHSRWWDNLPRPTPLQHAMFPYIGLLVDSNSIEVFRPRGRFDELKSYWDAKNAIYALKKEVGVMASKPHYALFSNHGKIGGDHDYKNHKAHYMNYLPYLQKTTEEHSLLPTDRNNASWALLGDSAYTGPPTDTPNLRRLAVNKSPKTQVEIDRQMELKRLRVPVECFFGRMWSKFKILRGVYRWDHSHFDLDYDICTLLTNEDIKLNQLVDGDAKFYRAVVAQCKARHEAYNTKRKNQMDSYRARKRARIECFSSADAELSSSSPY